MKLYDVWQVMIFMNVFPFSMHTWTSIMCKFMPPVWRGETGRQLQLLFCLKGGNIIPGVCWRSFQYKFFLPFYQENSVLPFPLIDDSVQHIHILYNIGQYYLTPQKKDFASCDFFSCAHVGNRSKYQVLKYNRPFKLFTRL